MTSKPKNSAKLSENPHNNWRSLSKEKSAMSTNKVTENTPVHEHFPNDAFIAIGATVSVLVLGGVLQVLSPKTETIATESAVSQPMTTYSETASTTEENGTSLEMTTSELVEPASEMSETTSFTSATTTETVAAAPMMAATGSTITDEATIQTLNSQVYNQIDQTWTTNPTFTANLVYQVKVTEAGAIASYEPITQAAQDYSNEIPLPSLTDRDSNSAKMANFVVVFTPGGQLEVSPWIAN